MTLKIDRIRAVVKVHVPAKFHQAVCSGSWVIVLTERKKTRDENNTVRRYGADNKSALKSIYSPRWCQIDLSVIIHFSKFTLSLSALKRICVTYRVFACNSNLDCRNL